MADPKPSAPKPIAAHPTIMRWAVMGSDGDPVGPLHETREGAERAVRFMNRYNPGLRSTVYRLGLLRMEEVPHAI